MYCYKGTLTVLPQELLVLGGEEYEGQSSNICGKTVCLISVMMTWELGRGIERGSKHMQFWNSL